jgi:hypothetical protein
MAPDLKPDQVACRDEARGKRPAFALRAPARQPRSLRERRLVGPGRVERPTSRLSGVRSNHLSYEPKCEMRNGLDAPRATTIAARVRASDN